MSAVISANWGSVTDIGLVRNHNEDAVYAQLPIFVVADGMGGHAAGEVASTLVTEEIRQAASSGQTLTIESVADAVERANARVLSVAQSSDGMDGMGTTVVGLALVQDRDQLLWLVFNVGDSRLYRLAEGVMAQITTDHSEVQRLIDDGTITPEGAKQHPDRNVITKAVGIDASVEPDFWLLPPVPGERFLLCSDGLTGEVADRDIESLLLEEPDPDAAAARLLSAALSAGGHDNISIVVLDVLNADHVGDEGDTARGVVNRAAEIEVLEPDDSPELIVGLPQWSATDGARLSSVGEEGVIPQDPPRLETDLSTINGTPTAPTEADAGRGDNQ